MDHVAYFKAKASIEKGSEIIGRSKTFPISDILAPAMRVASSCGVVSLKLAVSRQLVASNKGLAMVS
jgi:hypothetical protein